MKVGILLPNIGPSATRKDVLGMAKKAEKEGIDSVWVIDRLLWPIKPQVPYPATPDGSLPPEYQQVLDPLGTLAYVAGNTKKIALGTCIIDMLYSNPVALARQITTLDVLSGGRAIPGLGLGWSKDEYEASNVPFKERGARADEFLEVLKRIWTEDVVEFKGRFYSIPASKIDLEPAQKPHPPILLGGFTPKAFSRIAKYADGWIPIAGFGPLDQLAQAISALREEFRKANRDPSKVRIFVLTYPNILENPPAAPDEKRMPMTGTIDQIGSDIKQIKEMGAEHIMFGYLFSPLGADTKRAMEVTKQLAEFAR
jgi:probable F420-dependent oxidoreductase